MNSPTEETFADRLYEHILNNLPAAIAIAALGDIAIIVLIAVNI